MTSTLPQKEYTKEEALSMILQDTRNIALFSVELRSDEELVLASMYFDQSHKKSFLHPTNFTHASDKLKNDKRFVLKLIEMDGSSGILKEVNRNLLSDPELVLAAVKKNPSNFKLASTVLKDSYSIAHEAVIRDGCSIQYASSSLKDYDKLVYDALFQNSLAYQYISTRLKQKINVLNFIYEKSIKDYFVLRDKSFITVFMNKAFENYKKKNPDTHEFLIEQYKKINEDVLVERIELKTENGDTIGDDFYHKYFQEECEKPLEYIFSLLNKKDLEGLTKTVLTKEVNEILLKTTLKFVNISKIKSKKDRFLKF